MKTWQNITEKRPTFVTHLECGLSGEQVAADQLHGLSLVGRPFLVRYDLQALGESLDKETLAARPADIWRYREFLPVRRNENILSLGECMTPMIPAPRADGDLWIKDEGRLPTGSFKARGLCLAVSMAKELGVTRMAMPTNGNAGAAMAAYCRLAGIEAFVFCPDDTPETNIQEIALQGANVYCVNGLINDCGKIVGEGKETAGWFDLSTLKEPYRIEGKKTMGLELAEQCGWQLPDAIFYPTGGGTGLIGMWKAFDELETIGWIGPKRPKMIAVQSTGCAPIVKAYEDGKEYADLWLDAHTEAAGIRVPVAVGDFLILRAVRQSDGFAIAVDDETIFEARDEMAQNAGLLLCPEGAATYAAWRIAIADGRINRKDRCVLFNCATGLKYPMHPAGIPLDRHQPIDYGAML